MFQILFLPHFHTLAPLVRQQWRRFGIGRFDPGRKQPSLIRLIPQVLIQISVRYLLQGLYVVHGDQVAVEIHEFDPDFFEGTLREEVTLDT